MKRLIFMTLALLLTASTAYGVGAELYKPNYIATGEANDVSVTRYRLSVAFPISNGRLSLPRLPDGELKLAMTIEGTANNEESFSFQKENFNPVLFYNWSIGQRWLDQIKMAIEHLSSGEKGVYTDDAIAASNGFNRVFIETRTTLFEYDSLSVAVYVEPGMIIPWMFETNTSDLRDQVTFFGRDFYPKASMVVDWKDGRIWAGGHRDAFDVEGALRVSTILGVAGGALDKLRLPFVGPSILWASDKLRDRWNLHGLVRYHTGGMEDIGTYRDDVNSLTGGIVAFSEW